jgi:uncharacterized protein YcbK (DUF882 family)
VDSEWRAVFHAALALIGFRAPAGTASDLASLLLIATNARSVHNATADGDTRTLSFHHTHSGEDLTVTFKRSGRYDEAALKKLNHFLRDWRSQDSTTMDRRLFDIVWEVYRDVDGKQPIQIISAYRSPATNAMLRRRSSGVARHSQHMLGHAMDFFIPACRSSRSASPACACSAAASASTRPPARPSCISMSAASVTGRA